MSLAVIEDAVLSALTRSALVRKGKPSADEFARDLARDIDRRLNACGPLCPCGIQIGEDDD